MEAPQHRFDLSIGHGARGAGARLVRRSIGSASSPGELRLRNQSSGSTRSAAPGRSVEGFVYAQRSTKTESTKRLSVIVPIKNLETEIDTIFEFSIGYDR